MNEDLRSVPFACRIVVIKAQSSGEEGKSFCFETKHWCIIGSHKECDISIKHNIGPPLHALVFVRSNGVFLQGVHEKVPVIHTRSGTALVQEEEIKLIPDDIFVLGERKFKVKFEPPTSAKNYYPTTPGKTSVSTRTRSSRKAKTDGRKVSKKAKLRRRQSLLVEKETERFVPLTQDIGNLLTPSQLERLSEGESSHPPSKQNSTSAKSQPEGHRPDLTEDSIYGHASKHETSTSLGQSSADDEKNSSLEEMISVHEKSLEPKTNLFAESSEFFAVSDDDTATFGGQSTLDDEKNKSRIAEEATSAQADKQSPGTHLEDSITDGGRQDDVAELENYEPNSASLTSTRDTCHDEKPLTSAKKRLSLSARKRKDLAFDRLSKGLSAVPCKYETSIPDESKSGTEFWKTISRQSTGNKRNGMDCERSPLVDRKSSLNIQPGRHGRGIFKGSQTPVANRRFPGSALRTSKSTIQANKRSVAFAPKIELPKGTHYSPFRPRRSARSSNPKIFTPALVRQLLPSRESSPQPSLPSSTCSTAATESDLTVFTLRDQNVVHEELSTPVKDNVLLKDQNQDCMNITTTSTSETLPAKDARHGTNSPPSGTVARLSGALTLFLKRMSGNMENDSEDGSDTSTEKCIGGDEPVAGQEGTESVNQVMSDLEIEDLSQKTGMSRTRRDSLTSTVREATASVQDFECERNSTSPVQFSSSGFVRESKTINSMKDEGSQSSTPQATYVDENLEDGEDSESQLSTQSSNYSARDSVSMSNNVETDSVATNDTFSSFEKELELAVQENSRLSSMYSTGGSHIEVVPEAISHTPAELDFSVDGNIANVTPKHSIDRSAQHFESGVVSTPEQNQQDLAKKEGNQLQNRNETVEQNNHDIDFDISQLPDKTALRNASEVVLRPSLDVEAAESVDSETSFEKGFVLRSSSRPSKSPSKASEDKISDNSEVNEINLSNISKFRVVDLRRMLESIGSSTAGKKKDMIQRLQQHLSDPLFSSQTRHGNASCISHSAPESSGDPEIKGPSVLVETPMEHEAVINSGVEQAENNDDDVNVGESEHTIEEKENFQTMSGKHTEVENEKVMMQFYAKKTVKELRQILKFHNLKIMPKLRKNELIQFMISQNIPRPDEECDQDLHEKRALRSSRKTRPAALTVISQNIPLSEEKCDQELHEKRVLRSSRKTRPVGLSRDAN